MSFETILEAARTKNVALLNDALKVVCIDVSKLGRSYISAAVQLASEADLEKNLPAINFLLTHGTHIDSVALGAAIAGHIKYAEELLSRGANINEAARGAGIGGYREYAEELLGRGANINSVARGAAMGGHIEYAEELIGRGAHIDSVARGAAIGGHIKYVEELLGRGAHINEAARGAGLGGYREYVEELLGRSANINEVAFGAAQRGHIEYAEELLGRGANIDSVAQGASTGGHRSYVEKLLSRGAHIGFVAREIAKSGYILSGNLNSQILYLSFFNPSLISKLITVLKINDYMNIEITTQKRIVSISKHMHQNNLSYASALTRTDPICAGMLFLLMKISMKKGFSSLPLDVWTLIVNFVAPIKLSKQEIATLGFEMGRTYIQVQLSVYQSGWWINHRKSAKNFRKTVALANNEDALTASLNDQLQNQEFKKAIKERTVDKFYEIIGFWKKEITGIETVFSYNAEVEQESNVLEKNINCLLQ